MLTNSESAGARGILALMTAGDVFALAKTITKNQIVIGSVEDAIKAILTYAETPTDLLRRRAVVRKTLFQYLHNANVIVPPNADKFIIVQKILELWGSTNSGGAYLMEDEETAVVTQPVRIPPQNDMNCWRDDSLYSNAEDQEMALQFAKWFYPMLNACNPLYTAAAEFQDSFGPQHFFHDCALYMLSLVGGDDGVRSEEFNGADLVSQRLKALVADEKIIFNANIDPKGLRGASDPHGRRVIFVCGTVHRVSEVLGLFEQQFGLVRDPLADNNWKIKTARLALKRSATTFSMPTLDETRQQLAIQ